MSKAWGNIGAWAAEAERAEEEERAAAAASMVGPEPLSFPSLKEAATAKPKKKKMTLKEFNSSGSTAPGSSSAYKGLTPDEMVRLPTGPRERSAEELQHSRFGDGFSIGGRGPPLGRTRDEGDYSWGGGSGRAHGGGYDDDRRGPRPSRVSDFGQPSRSDEVDNWATTKKALPSLESSWPNRYTSIGGGGGGGSSRADEADNWTLGKRPQFQPPPPARFSSFGSQFRNSRPEPDRWTQAEPLPPERPRSVLAPPKENSDSGVNEPAKAVRPNPFGAARPREEVLAEKGLDYKKLDLEIEAKKTSRPTSASSSRPSSAQSIRSESTENALRPRQRVNPFGDAKPREVLLEHKGKNWRKIDFELEHRGVDRPETEQEKILKEDIENLKLELKGKAESFQGSEEDKLHLSLILSKKERDLESLTCNLDDKVRFGHKAVERPASRSGSVSSFSERPPSHSSSIDESHSVDHSNRPPSRGTRDAWARPINERRTYQRSRDRGFFTDREFDRTSSAQGW